MDQFNRILKRKNVAFIDDRDYRADALRVTFTGFRKRPLALCDVVLRLIMDDVNVRVYSLLTFNDGDFLDVCGRHGVQII
jgi:hypothetical protein